RQHGLHPPVPQDLMKTTRTPRPGVILATSLLLVSAAPSANALGASPLARLRQKLQSVIDQISGKKTEINQAKVRQRRVADQLNEAQAKVDDAQDRLSGCRARLTAAKQAVADARQRLREAEAKLELQKTRFKKRIAANYTQGPITSADVLLGAKELNSFLDREYFVEKVLSQDASVLTGLRQARERVEREHANLLARQQALAGVYSELAQRKQECVARANEQ